MNYPRLFFARTLHGYMVIPLGFLSSDFSSSQNSKPGENGLIILCRNSLYQMT